MITFKGSRLGVTTGSRLDILLSLRRIILARRCSSVGCLFRWLSVRGGSGGLSLNPMGPAVSSGNIDGSGEEKWVKGELVLVGGSSVAVGSCTGWMQGEGPLVVSVGDP